MPESLQSRLTYLRNRVRQMTWLYGLSWLAAVLFGLTFLAGFLDWSIRLEDAGVRLIFGLGILASTGWIVWRLLVRPLKREISDVEIALRIEKRYPGFNDSLASTVQFLSAQSDPQLGSPEMQQQVVERTVSQVEKVNLSDIVETRRVRKVALIAVMICLMTAGIASWNQAAAGTALHRLVFPFANRPWPKTTELRLMDESFQPVKSSQTQPMRLAHGDEITFFVEDLKGDPPEEVRFEYHFPGEEEIAVETLRRATVRDAKGKNRTVFVANVLAEKSSMAFRAVGGDDEEMPWQYLNVVPPPLVESMQITLTPPAYSKQPQETLPFGVGDIRGLVGTKVHLEFTTNHLLESARLHIKNQPPMPVHLPQDGHKLLTVDFEIPEAGVYSWWLDLKDWEGFENPAAPRYKVRGIADVVPDVTIEEPLLDRTVTPTATVPVRVLARDDLGLREIRLQYKLGNDSKTPLIPVPLFSTTDCPEKYTAEFRWDFTKLNLKPGQQIIFHAEALDEYDIDGKEHVGRSLTRKLTIVSTEEKTAELVFQQSRLVEGLSTIHTMQTQSKNQVGQLKIQLKQAGKLQLQDVDLLKNLESLQSQINARLSEDSGSLTAHTADLLKEMKQNNIQDPDMEQRLTGIAREIGILHEDHLSIIRQELTTALKLAQTEHGLTPEEDVGPKPQKNPQSSDQQTALDRADQHQQAVLDSLNELLDQLKEWRTHRDVTGEVRELIGLQKQLNQDTADVSQTTLGKSHRDLDPQAQADLARLGDRQRKVALRVENLGKSFQELLNPKSQENQPRPPNLSRQQQGILNDASAHLQEQSLAGDLQDTANQLDKNQIGEAAQKQRDAMQGLNELSDILQNRSVSDTQTLLKKLGDAREELEQLRKRQEELIKKREDAEKLQDPAEREQALEKLRQEQQQLRREASSMARRLRRLDARNSGSALRRAAARMEDAEQLLQENRQEQVEDEQQEILDDLEQAERELAQEEQQAKEQLAREMMERIGDELKSLIGRQEHIIEDTNRLEALRLSRGDWTRPQLKSLRDLAEVQRNLKTETQRLGKVVEAAEVFALALNGACREMERAAKRLEQKLTDGETIAHENAAKNRFTDLVTALEPEKNQKPGAEENQAGAGADGKTNAGPQSDGIPHLAQLKMLKTLQEDLIRRTQELDKIQQAQGNLNDDQKQELDLLAGEQGFLADLTRNLTAQFSEAFQTEPEEETPKGTKPESKPEPKKPATLEEQLNRDLNLDNLLPEDPKPEPKLKAKEPQASLPSAGLFAVQVELKKTTDPKPDTITAPNVKTDPEGFKGTKEKSAAPKDPLKNPLEEAINGMRSAQTLIQEKHTDEKTRKVQEEVVANLQRLIDMAKNQKSKPPSKSSSPPPPQNQQPKPQDGNPETQPDTPEQPKPQSEKPKSNDPQNRDNAEDSSEEKRNAKNSNANLQPRQELFNEVWGHLPPSIRQKLLNQGSGKYLPKYEDLARQYFEAIAEPEREFPGRSFKRN